MLSETIQSASNGGLPSLIDWPPITRSTLQDDDVDERVDRTTAGISGKAACKSFMLKLDIKLLFVIFLIIFILISFGYVC